MRLIDADELKEAMEEHTDYKGYLVCAPEEIIDLAPTVERPRGEWEQVGEMKYKCTRCGWIKNIGLMPYCENCGADMRKEGEKND